MYIPPKIWVVYLIAFLTSAFADLQPIAIPVRDFPSDARAANEFVRDQSGWFIAGSSIVKQVAGSWTTIPPPSDSTTFGLAKVKSGLLAAGEGFCEIYSKGKWTPLSIDDGIYFAEGNGAEALLAGHRGVYHVAADASWKLVFPGATGGLYYLHKLGQRLLVSTVEKGLLEWSDARQELVPFQPDTGWGRGKTIASLQELPTGAYFVASQLGFFIEDSTGEHAILADIAKEKLHEGLFRTYLMDRTIITHTLRGGIFAYSLDKGQLLWQIPRDSSGGAISAIKQIGNDILIGGSDGLEIIPDPLNYSFASLPKHEVAYMRVVNGDILVGTDSSGAFDLNGKNRGFEKAAAITTLPNGDVVEGRFGRIVHNGDIIDYLTQFITSLAPLDNDRVAFMQSGAIAIAQLSTKTVKPVEVRSNPNSLAASLRNKTFYVGTSEGVFQYTEQGKIERQFGHGITQVRHYRDGIVALDSTGTLYDESGAVIANLPVTGLISAQEWAGGMCLLAHASDGLVWAGILRNGEWKPLDIPLPMVPEAMVAKDDDLYIAGVGMVVKTSHPRLLEEPQARPILARSNGEELSNGMIRAGEDSVYLMTGPGRLYPWRNPKMMFKAGTGDWLPLNVTDRVAVPRLAWGTTPIAVHSEWGGLKHDEELSVFRATPWWARWPAFVLYIAGLGLFGYGIVRWRTWRLELRARRLEEVVEQRTAQLRQAQQAREDFFSTMSHEIRNPLNGVVGLCEIVENAPPEAVAPRERMLLKTLRGCADQLRSILDDVLDFSRIDRGDIQLHEESFELLGAIEGAARGVDAGLKRCVLELPSDPIYVRGDCGKIRQIVTNLVSNALKYGIPPAARVLLEVEPAGAGQLPFCIRVLNTGNTIPPEEINQIFSGYVRGEDAKRRRIVGTGLGLAVSRRIALAMKGSLNATSQNGLTEFRLDLKLPLTAAPVELPREANRPKTSRALGIEDEPYNRLVLGSILGQLGYEVDWAADGAEALAHARTGAYDLILTDFMLPDTTGTELARKILEMAAEPKPPIIAVTAYSTPEKIQQAKDAGIVGFVTKPVSRRKIEAAILEAIGEFSVGRVMELPEAPTVDCNFNLLLRLPDGAQKLAEYADDLPRAWSRVLDSLRGETPGQQARVVHAFRSRILAVHATAVAEQLGLLEEAAGRDAREDVDKLIGVIEPLLKEIEKRARGRALTLQPNV
jgi:signal transduction histidine kinase/CheY-like chemotaxis protein